MTTHNTNQKDQKLWKQSVANKVANNLRRNIEMVRASQEATHNLLLLAHDCDKEAVLDVLKNDNEMYEKFVAAAIFGPENYLELAYPALAAAESINAMLQEIKDR